MNKSVLLQTALCLPAPEVETLIEGRMIAATPRKLINSGQQFALYPANLSINLLPLERYYRSSFLPVAQKVRAELDSETVLIKAWARCELCQMLNDSESLEALSQLTVWTTEALQQNLVQRPYIFLAYLRVYLLPQPLEVPMHTQNRHFVPLPQQLMVSEATSVLSDRLFTQRRHQLENRLPPLHPELEELQSAIAQLAIANPAAQQLNQDIKIFLGWSKDLAIAQPDTDLVWIKTIAQVGNSSEGQDFEKLVRKALIKLGFTNSNKKPEASLDPNATGGAGGLDFYCEAPYPVVGECKASKNESVPNKVSAQLIHLGNTHLGKAQFDYSIKIIVVAGPLTKSAKKAAVENQMNVIRPETVQRLAELKAQHKGSINLLELKPCLQQVPFGEDADAKVNSYIDKVWQDIRLRSHIIQLVKKYLENADTESAGIYELHAVYIVSNPPQPVNREEMHEIMMELSSPLTGYLGRIKRSDSQSDRFYFLRDLKVY